MAADDQQHAGDPLASPRRDAINVRPGQLRVTPCTQDGKFATATCSDDGRLMMELPPIARA